MEEHKRKDRSLEMTREFRDAVVRLGEKWKRKGEVLDRERDQDMQEKGCGKDRRWGWKVATVDLWGAMVVEAGGEGEELTQYFLYVESSLLALFETFLLARGVVAPKLFSFVTPPSTFRHEHSYLSCDFTRSGI